MPNAVEDNQSGQFADNKFIKTHTPLVKRIAHHLMAKMPETVQVEDLIQAGMIGLMEAAKKYNDNKGASFTTYAGIRIRGSMLDEIRRCDWAPRSVHRNSRRVAQAVTQVEHQLGRDARNSEVANTLGVSLVEYHQMLQDAVVTKVYAIEDLNLKDEGIFNLHGNSLPTPLDKLQAQNFKHNLAEEIAKLPEREKLVLALYYDEDKNLKQVGHILGVSESRISQIHTQAMLRLQVKMDCWKS
jgi:RNA polymerase sigma factor for flagellar operon FliA